MPKIVIETDGTSKNTSLTVDGKKVNNLSGINLYASLNCWCNETPCWCTYVDLSYEIEKVNKEKEMKVRTRYTLDKATASLIEEEDFVDIKNPVSDDYIGM